MSQKIDGTPPPNALRGTSAASGPLPRAGNAGGKAIEAPAPGDSLRLTGEAAGLQALQRQLATAPAVDVERVQAVREALASGNYRVDPEAIAARMLELDAALSGR